VKNSKNDTSLIRKIIDINCDMAELDSIDDLAFMPYISSCNICCGYHAGNPNKIIKTIRAAIVHDLKIGAHPSYPDRLNFGRKSMDMDPSDLKNTLIEQIVYIKEIVEKEGGKLHHVKAHGALYNDLYHRPDVVDVFLEAVAAVDKDLEIYALAHTQVTEKIGGYGYTVVPEAFMDRSYSREGTLANRELPGTVYNHLDQVLAQLDLLLQKKVKTELSDILDLPHDTICLHTDTPYAIEWIPEIYKFIKSESYEIT